MYLLRYMSILEGALTLGSLHIIVKGTMSGLLYTMMHRGLVCVCVNECAFRRGEILF